MILYVAGDLIWATRIKATADDLGVPARPVRSLEMLDARLEDEPVGALIVDLEHPAAIDLIRGCRRSLPKAPIVAFGPHKDTQRLQDARDAGASEVLPRGAFDHGLPEILVGLQGRAGSREK